MIPNLFNPQNLNRYAFELGNPYRYTDSTGRYQEDVHQDLTEYLAIHANYNADDAKLIANANQDLDDDLRTKPTFLPNVFRGVTKHYHFQSREEAQRRIANSNSLSELGQAMHTFQDTFSHEGYDMDVWRLEFGHLGDWEDPDLTYLDPGKADQMAFGSYYQLSAKNGLNNAQIINGWLNIQPTVKKFNRAEGRDTKRKILGFKGGSIRISKSQYKWGKHGSGTNAYCKRNCG